MNKDVTFPGREQIFKVLSSINIGSDLQSSLQSKLIAQAGNTVDEAAAARIFAFAVNSFMAGSDEVMRNHVNTRACEVIDLIFTDELSATEIKNLFIKLSNASSH